ncbi:MAG: SpoIID/LytB domain-containing protein [Christensenellales bacterium]
MKNRKRTAKFLSLAMAIMMVLGLFLPETTALGENIASEGVVRVLLSVTSSTTRTFTASADYTVKESTSLQAKAGSCTVSIVDGVLALTSDGRTTKVGSKLTLLAPAGATLSISNSLYGTRKYLGDMEFSIYSGAIRIINYVGIESYLYGVVPYEMSNSWPIEALKTQAVCARGYVVARMKSYATRSYHVTDTSTYQVYKGYDSSTTNAVSAVNATAGQVLTSGGSIVDTYYSASNGGQTETSQNAWGTALSYSVMKDDPYDLRNPYSLQELSFIPAEYNETTIALMDAIVYNTLLSGAKAALSNDAAVLVSTVSVTPHSPKYPAPSRSFAKADVALNVQAGETTAQVTVTLTLDSLIYNSSSNPGGIFNLSNSMRLRGAEAATRTSGGNTYPGWNLTNRRWGHGVGMSQRGAQQMANEGIAYTDILAFYFEGTSIGALSINGSTPPPPAPTPTPTEPAPTPPGETPPADATTVASSVYAINGSSIRGIGENTDATVLLGNITVTNGTLALLSGSGQAKTSGSLCTGDLLRVLRVDGSLKGDYSIILSGDVNNDGTISLLDLLKVQKHLLSTSLLTNCSLVAGDIDGDGEITLLDLLKVQKHLLGTAHIA